MAQVPIYAGDSFSIVVSVIQIDGSPLPLNGATVTASAEISGTKIAGSATVTDEARGVVTVTWAPALLTAGTASLQVRVAFGSSEAQTVWTDSLVINPSAI